MTDTIRCLAPHPRAEGYCRKAWSNPLHATHVTDRDGVTYAWVDHNWRRPFLPEPVDVSDTAFLDELLAAALDDHDDDVWSLTGTGRLRLVPAPRETDTDPVPPW